jgi:hypothetical protein
VAEWLKAPVLKSEKGVSASTQEHRFALSCMGSLSSSIRELAAVLARIRNLIYKNIYTDHASRPSYIE